MKTTIQIVTGVLCIVASAHAQQAVQWKVSDGGNGHWYRGLRLSEDAVSWTHARTHAQALGGELAQLETPSELDWVYATVARNPDLWRWTMGPWLGGFQTVGSEEPAQGWRWINGARIDPTMWAPGEPFDYVLCGDHENYLNLFCNVGCEAYPTPSPRPTVNDVPESGFCDCCNNGSLRVWVNSAIIEWSADCNGDGTVDYGQCHDGTLPDYNGNNIPDCCERGEACVVGNYPVQWRDEDGGNGHWYAVVSAGLDAGAGSNWEVLDSTSRQRGGRLCTIGDSGENSLVSNLVTAFMPVNGFWAYLGATQIPSVPCDRDSWAWNDGTSWTFTNWQPQQPDCLIGSCTSCNEPKIAMRSFSGQWGDWNGRDLNSAIVEWSADCNSDGIVDYGQILTGQLADSDSNGVPDICQQPTCVAADIYRDFNVNGADLGILLSQWGPNTPLTESDLDGDGIVNGADLGILLSYWGECP